MGHGFPKIVFAYIINYFRLPHTVIPRIVRIALYYEDL